MDESTRLPARASIPDAPRLALFNPEATTDNRVTTRRKPRGKPKSKAKPQDDCPLTQRADGRWCKKVRGTIVYFGRDKDAAIELWEEQKTDLLNGRTPRPKSDGLLVGELAERFLNAKRALVESGELSPRTFGQYHSTCKRIVARFGKHRRVDDLASEDFESLRAAVGKTCGVVAISNEIRLTRIVFKYGYDAGLIPAPIRFGPTFKVKKETIRKAAAGKPARMFEAAEIRKLLDAADDVANCWILLGINCAFGQADLAALQQGAIDWKEGSITFPRPKTGVERKCVLWPQTLEALRKAIALRPEPKDAADADCVFLTPHRNRLVRATAGYGHRDLVGVVFGRLLVQLGMKRQALGFYALRHTFRTIADETRDFPAIDRIMGHSDHTMGGRYRERIDDARLQAVVEHVRGWLFPAKRKPR